MISWKVLLLAPLVAITGCTEKVSEREGSSVDIYPVTYSIALDKPSKSNSSKLLNEFMLEHENQLLNHGAEIQWFTNSGKSWANKVRRTLLSKGVPTNLIEVTQGVNADKRFDLMVLTTTYKTQVPLCDYLDVYDIAKEKVVDGCYPESNRWISMVNPQKMLLDVSETKAVEE